MKIKYKTRNLSDPKEWIPYKTYLVAINRKDNPLNWGNQAFLFKGWKGDLILFNNAPYDDPHEDWTVNNLMAIPSGLPNYKYNEA